MVLETKNIKHYSTSNLSRSIFVCSSSQWRRRGFRISFFKNFFLQVSKIFHSIFHQFFGYFYLFSVHHLFLHFFTLKLFQIIRQSFYFDFVISY